jgi:hypothetical protein
VLLMPRRIEGAAQGEAHPDGAVLLMEKDNIVYMVSGSNSYEELLRIAESMF